MCLEDLAANIDQMTVGLDDTFQFHCFRFAPDEPDLHIQYHRHR